MLSRSLLRSLRLLLLILHGLLIRTGKDHPHQAVGQFQLVEIDDQSHGNIQEFHVTEELGLVDRQNLLHTLEFQQEAILDQTRSLEPVNFDRRANDGVA